MWPRLALLSLLCGCAPSFQEDTLAHAPVPALLQGMEGSGLDRVEDGWPTREWWTSLGDEQLNQLIGIALEGNPKMAAAFSRVERAVASQAVAQSANFPQMNVIPSFDILKYARNGVFGAFIPPTSPVTFGVTQLLFTFNWMIDIWGRVEHQLKASRADTERQIAEWCVTRWMLAQQITQSYVHWQSAMARSHLQRERVSLLKKIEALLGFQQSSAINNAIAVDQAHAQRLQADATLAGMDLDVMTTHHVLQELVGRPDGLIQPLQPRSTTQLALDVQSHIPASLPMNLLGRRPDVVASRHRVETLAELVRVARTAYYPNIDFTGSYFGLQTTHIDELFQPGSLSFQMGPALTLPWFDGGARGGRYDSSVASYDESVADYRQVVLQATREVLDAISQHRQAREALRALSAAEVALQAVCKKTEALSQHGLASTLPTLQVRLECLNAEEQVILGSEQILQAHVQLQVALGGGFSDAT